MHPRAIVGPPGTMPHLNPSNGMPSLRRGGRLFGMPSGSTRHSPSEHWQCINACTIWERGSQAEADCMRGCAAISAPLPPTEKHQAPSVAARPKRTFLRPIKARRPNVSVGACFPKFDPIQQYGVGAPPAPMPNPQLAAASSGRGIDPRTGMPRLRSRIWYR